MFVKYILPTLIIVGAIAISAIFIVLSKHTAKHANHTFSSADGFMAKPRFIKSQYIEMYRAIKSVLPENIIIQTKVTLDTFILYNGYEVDKKKLLTKYVDMVIFAESDFMPILALDLYNYDTTLESMQVLRKDIVGLLNSCGIPCISLPVEMAKDPTNLQKTLLGAMKESDLNKIGVI